MDQVTANEPLDPFAIRVLESMPGIATGATWNAGRGAKTILEGARTGSGWSQNTGIGA